MADTGGASSHLRWADIAMALRYPLLVVLVLTALWGTIGVYLRATYRDAIATGEQSARDLARGLEESIVGGLNAVELSLLFVREAYLHDPDGPDVGAWAKSKPATQGLIMQIAMTDRHGMMTASNIGSGKPVDLSDREHIRVHIDDPGNDFLFVSKPVLGRNSGKWSIQFPRKLFDKDHAFTGVVVASVDPYYLSRFYDSIKPGSGSVVLMGTDRIVRARAPAPEKYIGQLLADGPHYHADAPATGVTRRLANTDGVERIYGYRKLADYPLIVQAGLNISDILEDYALNRQLAVFAGGAGSLLVLLTGLLLHSSDRRLRASRATLRAAVEHVSQGIILIDAHGAVRLVSSQAQAMLGLPDSLIAATPRFSDLVEWQKRFLCYLRLLGMVVCSYRFLTRFIVFKCLFKICTYSSMIYYNAFWAHKTRRCPGTLCSQILHSVFNSICAEIA